MCGCSFSGSSEIHCHQRYCFWDEKVLQKEHAWRFSVLFLASPSDFLPQLQPRAAHSFTWAARSGLSHLQDRLWFCGQRLASFHLCAQVSPASPGEEPSRPPSAYRLVGGLLWVLAAFITGSPEGPAFLAIHRTPEGFQGVTRMPSA